MEIELAKDIRESLSARVIGGTGSQFNNEETKLIYHIVNDYIARNEEANVDLTLPFDVVLALGEVS